MHVNVCQVGDICCWQCDKIAVTRWVIWVSYSESAYVLTLTICSNNNYHCFLGLYSPIDKTCYHQISRSLGAVRVDVMINVSLWNTCYIHYISICTRFCSALYSSYCVMISLRIHASYTPISFRITSLTLGMTDPNASNVNVDVICKIDHYQTTT